MAAFADLSEVVNRMTGGNSGNPEVITSFKSGRVGASAAVAVAGQFSSLWQYNGQRPTHGSAPGGTARNPTSATAGAVGQQNAGSLKQRWLLALLASNSARGSLFLGDRLADISGLSGTSTAAQSISSLSVSRYTSTAAIGNEIWIEIYTQIGSTATTVTVTYTNQAGTALQVSQPVAIGGTGLREVQRFIRVPLAAGDTGVRSVESITLAASTGTAGDLGVTIVRPYTFAAGAVIGASGGRDLIARHPGPIAIPDGAALFYYFLASTTTPPDFHAWLIMGDR